MNREIADSPLADPNAGLERAMIEEFIRARGYDPARRATRAVILEKLLPFAGEAGCTRAVSNRKLVWRRSCDWNGSPPMPTQSSLQTSDTTAVLAALFDGPECGVPAGARIFCPGDI